MLTESIAQGKLDSKTSMKIVGYTVFLVQCANGSFYSGMCRDLNKKLKNLAFEPYFKTHPGILPVRVVFREDRLLFKEAFAKHKYLRNLTKRLRNQLIRTEKWPAGKNMRRILMLTD